ncbi:hypothetical protein JSY36_16935 [Bacillus sp. H-16]|uniref:hypothetical protein n=1 Tax=Alteribacter salitolerans TaxID=2912333 RepID=UPI0019667F66|nr:hypothetical protein [Alteribacter salitolerans]MBM7097421.1 hypothetical protein [Alteribacter salitolerans]
MNSDAEETAYEERIGELEEEIKALLSELDEDQKEHDLSKQEYQERIDVLESKLAEQQNGLEETESGVSQFQLSNEEDFYTQFWFSDDKTDIEEELGFEPGITDWQTFAHEGDDHEGDGGLSISALALDWIRERELDVHMDTEEELAFRTQINYESGIGKVLVLLWGLKDDAVAGTDYLLHFNRTEEKWNLEEVEVRHYCRRSVTEDRAMCN